MILLLGVSYLLYVQLTKVDFNNWKKLELKHPLFAIISFLLLFVNWFLEWKKWKITLDVIKTETTTQNNFRAFMAGITTGLVTPNMLGNFLGRMYYFKRNLRPSIILLTLLSNFSQFIASIFFGFLSFLFLRETPLGIENIVVGLTLFILILFLLLFYFFFEKIKWPYFQKKKSFSKVVTLIKHHRRYKSQLLSLSFLRHFIFTLQFWLMFNAFEDALNKDAFLWIWQIFLWTTLVPSLWFGKLVIRESIALLVLVSVGYGQVEILTTSILIWLINLAIPAMTGLIICNRNKVD